MDTRTRTSQPREPFDPVEAPRQGEPVAEPVYQASAAQQTSKESRTTEPVVGTDGQLVEAGYGHGV
jgi:hypothetical protein